MSASRRFTTILASSLAIACLLAQPAMAQRGKKPPSPKLTVTLDSTSVEIGGTVSGTVAHDNPDTSAAVFVTLSSSPVTFEPVPVNIAADQSTASFTVAAGTTAQSVTITAAANGYQSGSTSLTVTPPPPPGYEIKYIYVKVGSGTEVSYIIPLEINEMNNLGQVVGKYYLGEEQRAFLYDPLITDDTATPIGEAWDLSLLVDPSTIDPELTISSAVGINDKGDIVGSLQPIGTGWDVHARQAYAMHWNTATDMYTLQIIPSVDGRSMYGRRINEAGDILCYSTEYPLPDRSWLYNPGWYGPGMELTELALPLNELSDVLTDGDGNVIGPAVCGYLGDGNGGHMAHRILPWSGTIEHFDFDGVVNDVNGDGVFCGWATVEVLVRKSSRLQAVPYLYDNSLQPVGDQNFRADAININQDVLLGYGYYRDYAHLYHSDFGSQKLDDLVTGTGEDMSYWFAASKLYFDDLNDRTFDVTGEVGPAHYGQICGEVQVSTTDYRFFVLTPVAR